MEQYLLMMLIGAVAFAGGYAVCWGGTWWKLARVESVIRALRNRLHNAEAHGESGDLDVEWLAAQLDTVIHEEFA